MNTRWATVLSAGLLAAACGGGQDDMPGADSDPHSPAAEGPRQRALATGLAADSPPADAALPGEVLVKLRRATDLPAVLQQHRLRRVASLGPRPIYRLRLIGSTDVDAKVAALRADARVLVAEPNFQSSSPEARKAAVWAIGEQSQYTAQWAPQAIGLAAAHALGTGVGMRVAVLDTGVDLQHPALAGRLLPGRDYIDGDQVPAEGGGPDNLAWGHGTHVAGLVALTAPGARIMPMRCWTPTVAATSGWWPRR